MIVADRLINNLNTAFGKTGLSQREVAELAGITETTLNKWLCGRGLPSLELLYKVCKVMGVTVDEVMEGAVR